MSSACSATAASAAYRGSCWTAWESGNVLFSQEAVGSTPHCRVRRARVEGRHVEMRHQPRHKLVLASFSLSASNGERAGERGRGEASICSARAAAPLDSCARMGIPPLREQPLPCRCRAAFPLHLDYPLRIGWGESGAGPHEVSWESGEGRGG